MDMHGKVPHSTWLVQAVSVNGASHLMSRSEAKHPTLEDVLASLKGAPTFVWYSEFFHFLSRRARAAHDAERALYYAYWSVICLYIPPELWPMLDIEDIQFLDDWVECIHKYRIRERPSDEQLIQKFDEELCTIAAAILGKPPEVRHTWFTPIACMEEEHPWPTMVAFIEGGRWEEQALANLEANARAQELSRQSAPARVRAVTRQLSKKDLKIFRMLADEKNPRKVAEIADLLGMTESAVNTRISRARKKLLAKV